MHAMMFSILSCVCLTFRCFHWLKNLFKPFAHFLKIWFFLSYSSVFGVFAYSGYKSLIYMFRIFFVSLCHVFLFSQFVFIRAKDFMLVKFNFSTFSFLFYVLCCEKQLLVPSCKDFLLCILPEIL